MNIVFIAHSLYPIAEPYEGGLEKITQLLVNKITNAGHNVTLFAKEGSDTSADLISFPSLTEFNELFYPNEHEGLGMSREEMYQVYIYNWAINKIHSLDYDIIHNHSLHHIPIIRSLEFGEKFFTTFHTPIFTQLDFGLKSLKGLNSKSQFTSISKYQQSLYSEYTDSHLVYNGIEIDEWNFNISNKKDHFFWMGRICPEKAPHHAAEACLAAEENLFIAGPISHKDYYEQYLKPLLENENIHYVGHLTKKEINNNLCNSKAYIFTSLWDEPYGLTLAESLASGTPVIAYDVGAVSEIITKNCGIIVDRGDIQSLSKSLGDIDYIERQSCRTRAEQFCNIDDTVTEYLKLY